MSSNTRIKWCSATWNPWWGCTPVSEGCEHCYAARFASRKMIARNVNLAANGKWTGITERITDWMDRPREWKTPSRIFVCSMSDFFYEGVPQEWRERAWTVVRECPQHMFLVLTKRPENIEAMLPADWGRGYPNVWLGVTAETDARARERVGRLLEIPVHSAQRFVSCEPLLGPIDFSSLCQRGDLGHAVSWVIAGGETGLGARPTHVYWFRKLRDACELHGAPFFFKGWGAWIHHSQTTWSTIQPPAKPRYDWGDGSWSVRWRHKALAACLDGTVRHEKPNQHTSLLEDAADGRQDTAASQVPQAGGQGFRLAVPGRGAETPHAS